jgi:hypothetical protein
MNPPLVQLRSVSRGYPLNDGPYYALRGINGEIQ